MEHNIYNTEGMIINSFGIGEANKFFNIFTKDFGMLQATAQSVRELKSKNRYGLQDFSVSDFSFVRGRDVWRITNVSSKENLFFNFKDDRGKIDSLVRIFNFLKKLVHGEEKNESLYNIIYKAVSFLKKNDFDKNIFDNLSIILEMRILNNLGYFDTASQKDIFVDFLKTNEIDRNICEKLSDIKKEAMKEVEKSLNDTHL